MNDIGKIVDYIVIMTYDLHGQVRYVLISFEA